MLEILKYPHPVLRKKAAPVNEITDSLRSFAQQMKETMYEHAGIGLAATQVGHLIRLFVMDTRPRMSVKERYEKIEDLEMTELEKNISQPLCFFNPQILSQKGKTSFKEGCLSLPGYYEEVFRSAHIQVQALNEKGESFSLDVNGLMAICIQHEIDHLDGKLFIDRISPIKSLLIQNQIKKKGYPDPKSSHSKETSSKKE